MADNTPSKAEAKVSEVRPTFLVPEDKRNPRDEPQVIPKKGSETYETPSGYALAKVGENKAEPGSEEARDYGFKVLYERLKKRWGIGAD